MTIKFNNFREKSVYEALKNLSNKNPEYCTKVVYLGGNITEWGELLREEYVRCEEKFYETVRTSKSFNSSYLEEKIVAARVKISLKGLFFLFSCEKRK